MLVAKKELARLRGEQSCVMVPKPGVFGLFRHLPDWSGVSPFSPVNSSLSTIFLCDREGLFSTTSSQLALLLLA